MGTEGICGASISTVLAPNEPLAKGVDRFGNNSDDDDDDNDSVESLSASIVSVPCHLKNPELS